MYIHLFSDVLQLNLQYTSISDLRQRWKEARSKLHWNYFSEFPLEIRDSLPVQTAAESSFMRDLLE